MDVVTLQGAKADAAKRYNPTGGNAAVLMNRLSLGQENAVAVVLGDSTGVTQTRWVYLMAQWLAAQFPAYTVNYRQYNDGATSYDALGTTGSSQVIQTGTGTANNGGPFVLDVYNASVSGMSVTYPLTKYSAMMPVTPQLVFINFGHNSIGYNASAYRPQHFRLVRLIQQRYGNQGTGIVLVGQNPRAPIASTLTGATSAGATSLPTTGAFGSNVTLQVGAGTANVETVTTTAASTGTSVAVTATTKTHASGDAVTLYEYNLHLQRLRVIADMAAAEGLGFINVTQAFLNTPSWATALLNSDGLHPSDAGGSPLWAREVEKHLSVAQTVVPRLPAIRELFRWIPASAFTAFSGTPALAVVNGEAPMWSMVNAADSSIMVSLGGLPDFWSSADVYVVWATATGSGNTSANAQVRWHALVQAQGVGFVEEYMTAQAPGAWTDVGSVSSVAGNAGAYSTNYQQVLGNYFLPSTSRPYGLQIKRAGAADAASDNLAATAYVLGVLLMRAT